MRMIVSNYHSTQTKRLRVSNSDQCVFPQAYTLDAMRIKGVSTAPQKPD